MQFYEELQELLRERGKSGGPYKSSSSSKVECFIQFPDIVLISYEVNDHLSRMEVSRRAWDYPSTMQIEEPTTIEMQHSKFSELYYSSGADLAYLYHLLLILEVLNNVDVFVFPIGVAHFQQNVGTGNAVALIALSSQNPKLGWATLIAFERNMSHVFWSKILSGDNCAIVLHWPILFASKVVL
ncbi:Cupin 1 [Dillenia turbinata]|uniref:Cupin 1 n=1 Tax=Dillenia turbinata TaxID=194707 RepID=A0AAN8V7J3_9MAGN